MQQSQRNQSLEEYFDVENHSDRKFEYFAGQILAVPGASFRHNQIARNIVASLRDRLRGSRCEVLGSLVSAAVELPLAAIYEDVFA